MQILREASFDVDTVHFNDTYMHAMSNPGQSVEEAQQQYRDFICSQLRSAQSAPTRYGAIRQLGMGMHAIMDSTSPSHRGFQVWVPMDIDPIGAWRHRQAESTITPNDLEVTVDLLRGYFQDFESGIDCSCKY
jgi:hypothetical protein